jgi:hypothetical protein
MAYKIKKSKSGTSWRINEDYSPYYQETKYFVSPLRKGDEKEFKKYYFGSKDRITIAKGFSKKELEKRYGKDKIIFEE